MDDAVIAEVRAREWTPGSWRGLEGQQMATYDDAAAYGAVMSKLSKLPPLVQPAEVNRLTELLAQAGRGERFIIQGGDCAERFIDCEPERLEAQLAVLAQMGAILERAAGLPTIRIARIAGQYGKPRSKPTETVDGLGEIYSFKGDNINGYDPKDRAWDPKRLLEGYWHSAATLNFLCAACHARARARDRGRFPSPDSAARPHPAIQRDLPLPRCPLHGSPPVNHPSPPPPSAAARSGRRTTTRRQRQSDWTSRRSSRAPTSRRGRLSPPTSRSHHPT